MYRPCGRRPRTSGAALAVLGALALGAPASGAAPHCLTPVASDGNEPPCNPYLAGSVWATPHRGSYAQGSSPYPGPHAGDPIRVQDIEEGDNTPVILQISSPYPDGRRTVWFTTVSVPEQHVVYKVDYDTGAEIDHASILDEPGGRPGTPTTSAVYNLLDRDNHLFAIRGNALAVYGDAQPHVRTSPLTLRKVFTLPARALCRSDDRILAITMTFDGRVAFATVEGMVGVIPRQPRRMTDRNLVVASINGRRCADASIPADDLEQVSNSMPADENGGIYPVSNRAQYRYRLAGHRLRLTWRTPYRSGGGTSGSTLSDGSGSTPDVVGTHPGADRFIVITDGQKLMHLVYLWRDRIPRNWRGLPGRPRRIACEYPVRFGDPHATESVSEQSVLTRGYSSVVVDNALALDRVFSVLPPSGRPLATLTSNLDPNAPHGMERIDWDPRTRRCHSVWANRTVSIPNAVPTMSTESGLIYGMGVRDAVWGLEGVDFRTGRTRLWIPTSPLPTDNSFFAATTVGPDGSIWIGGVSGLDVFRGPKRRPPRLRCTEIDPRRGARPCPRR